MVGEPRHPLCRYALLKSKRAVRVQAEAGVVELRLRIEAVVQLGAERWSVFIELHEAVHDAGHTVKRAVRAGGQVEVDGVYGDVSRNWSVGVGRIIKGSP